MSGPDIQPRIVLCVLHDRPEVIEAIAVDSRCFEYDAQYSDCGRDERIPKAFELSWDRVQPTASNQDKERVLGHRNVAYAVSDFITPESAHDIASDGLSFIAKCFEEGARAVKCDSSGIAHGESKWIELAAAGESRSLYFSYVRRPLGSDQRMYSCGMHLLGLPDTEVIGFSDWEAARIIDLFSLFLLTEGGDRKVKPGHTFSCSANDPVLTLERVDCLDYEKDDFFYNPYGYWRLERRNVSGKSAQVGSGSEAGSGPADSGLAASLACIAAATTPAEYLKAQTSCLAVATDLDILQMIRSAERGGSGVVDLLQILYWLTPPDDRVPRFQQLYDDAADTDRDFLQALVFRAVTETTVRSSHPERLDRYLESVRLEFANSLFASCDDNESTQSVSAASRSSPRNDLLGSQESGPRKPVGVPRKLEKWGRAFWCISIWVFVAGALIAMLSPKDAIVLRKSGLVVAYCTGFSLVLGALLLFFEKRGWLK